MKKQGISKDKDFFCFATRFYISFMDMKWKNKMKMILLLDIQLTNVMTSALVCINPRNEFQMRMCHSIEAKIEVYNLGQIV